MANQTVFLHTDPDLVSVLEQLRLREPIFHTPEFGSTRAEFEKATAPEYWETSASGRRYSREFILRTLEQNPPVDAVGTGWQCYDHALRWLGPDTYLLTYTLRQVERVTRPFGRLRLRAGAFSIIRAQSFPPRKTTRSLVVGLSSLLGFRRNSGSFLQRPNGRLSGSNPHEREVAKAES